MWRRSTRPWGCSPAPAASPCSRCAGPIRWRSISPMRCGGWACAARASTWPAAWRSGRVDLLGPQDVLLAISFTPYAPETIRLAALAAERGAAGRGHHRQPVLTAHAERRDLDRGGRDGPCGVPLALGHVRAGDDAGRGRGGTARASDGRGLSRTPRGREISAFLAGPFRIDDAAEETFYCAPGGRTMNKVLDVITIGRSSVDLYGQQVGTRLEDMASFSKAVGGCPANIAIGTARLGLKSGVITRVGDEHFGRFIREQMEREGVALDGIHTDPARLTALAVLGVRDSETFPLIFYRTDCADAALDERDIDEAFRGQRRRDRGHGHAFRAPEQCGRPAPRDRDLPPSWRPGGVRRRLPSQSLGSGRAWRRREPLYPLRHGVGAPGRDRAALRPCRRHRGRAAYRRRRGRHARGDPAHSRTCAHGHDRLQARPDGLRGVRGRHSRRHRAWGQGARLSVEVYNTLGAATRSCRASCAAGSGASRSRRAAPMRTRAAPSPCRACSARRKVPPSANCSTSCSMAAPIMRCAMTPR